MSYSDCEKAELAQALETVTEHLKNMVIGLILLGHTPQEAVQIVTDLLNEFDDENTWSGEFRPYQ